jgi:hypothetical protein
MVKSRRMRWAGHTACMGQTREQSVNLNGRDHLGDLDIDGRIILNWILKN